MENENRAPFSKSGNSSIPVVSFHTDTTFKNHSWILDLHIPEDNTVVGLADLVLKKLTQITWPFLTEEYCRTEHNSWTTSM